MFGKRKKENSVQEESSVAITSSTGQLLTETESEVELAIDVYQTPTEIMIESPIAGVRPEDIEVHIENDMITIRGERRKEEQIEEKDYFYQECYWGSFSRTVALPINEVDIDKASAEMKNGILRVRIPKAEKKRSKKLKVVSEGE